MYDGIIFDMDGTIWDSRETIVKAWNDELKAQGIDRVITVSELTGYMGLTMDAIAEGIFPDKKYSETKPDLVLMDITMPEMDGIQALKKIKEQDPGATVIMCSAMGQQAMVIESIQAGAKDFIVKPFQADRVIEAVKKVVG